MTIAPAQCPGLLMNTAPFPSPMRVKSSMPETKRAGLTLSLREVGAVRELHLTARPEAGRRIEDWLEPLIGALQEHDATVVRCEVFGRLDARDAVFDAWKRRGGAIDWPVMWLESGGRAPVAGLHLFAVGGADVETIRRNGRPVGCAFSDGHTRQCLLGEILPCDLAAPRERQALQVFEETEDALGDAGFAMRDVVRTWLFFDDILAWYGPFNEVRRRFFEERGMFDGIVPASTGIGAPHPAGAALVAGAWAVRAAAQTPSIGEVGSPLQCPAPAYGSAFSRAVEICAAGWRRVLVSGTASIAPGGASVCVDDVDGQIDLTLQVVRAILVSRGMEYGDVTRATAYLRHDTDRAILERWLRHLGLEDWPLVITQAVVCRDELLFEIELDAMARSASCAGVAPLPT